MNRGPFLAIRAGQSYRLKDKLRLLGEMREGAEIA